MSADDTVDDAHVELKCPCGERIVAIIIVPPHMRVVTSVKAG
jgi:hypothetical protein